VTYQDKHNEANLENNADGNSNNRSWNSGVEGETDDPGIKDLRLRRIRAMLTSLVLSTGTPMLVAGDEMGRTQHGNNNAYCQDNDISWVDWDLADWQQDLLKFTRKLLGVRNKHRSFRQRYFFDGRPVHEGGPEDLAWFGPDGQLLSDAAWNSGDTRSIGMFLSGDRRGHLSWEWVQRDSSFLLLLNARLDDVEFTLPGAPYGSQYQVILDTSGDTSGATNPRLSDGDTVMAEGYTCILLEITKR